MEPPRLTWVRHLWMAAETFTFTIVSEDDETENNEIVRQISSSKTTTNNLEVTVRTDAAPQELGWEIDVDGNVVEEVLAGTEMTSPQTTYTWNVHCLSWDVTCSP